MKSQRAVVLGAGAWGTALAVMLSRSGRPTTLCVRRPAQVELLRGRSENTTYLPGIKFPPTLEISGRWPQALAQAHIVILAIPSSLARSAIAEVVPAITAGAIVISAAKGIEQQSLVTMSAMLRELCAPGVNLAVLSGPGFAAEIAAGRPAALVAASSDNAIACEVQQIFSNSTLRVYRSSDVLGVELAGAVKNVIAIATGIGDGLELGSSARAAVITRGLAELARLAVALGARFETIGGLAGLGDLVLTCTGDLSRNRALGIRLGRGEKVSDAARFGEGQPIAEGFANARSVVELARRAKIEMPIVEGVYRALYEAEPPRDIVEGLLSRELKAEF
ncbi:MAG: NAD(P)-dependent glycerol-3-phosphate dehydrogenase [Candidatus Binataceae bacterium]|nr:NAD(P)-dependent glycerol-3-phosphate dehydrogenase [Candidatus Binataceae bacterium]